MSLPIEIQRLCDQYLLAVRADPQHEFSLIDRLNFYHSFYSGQYNQPFDFAKDGTVSYGGYGPFQEQQMVNVALPDYAISWLGILSAQRVLPVWEQSTKQLGRPVKITAPYILDVALEFLHHKVTIQYILDKLCNDIHAASGNLAYSLTKNVYLALSSAYEALETIAINHAKLKTAIAANPGKVSSFGDFAKTAVGSFGDFAKTAAEAYCLVDKNPPGLWLVKSSEEDFEKSNLQLIEILQNPKVPLDALDKIVEDYGAATGELDATLEDILAPSPIDIERAERLKNFIPLEYDIQKRLEFWEWWLGEAIPQAWELGEQSWANRPDKF